ncbi:hypothetical protein G5I_11154 [Acromyrmex echinatior]|uniref:Uncharacterized protein n=1 Tax=Acromyrmex echinatior TaxID=103372 RepID=F4WYU0_ACREC|nr:hypothetical protein G5I_11154 [Acromyrmex echinatior]
MFCARYDQRTKLPDITRPAAVPPLNKKGTRGVALPFDQVTIRQPPQFLIYRMEIVRSEEGEARYALLPINFSEVTRTEARA